MTSSHAPAVAPTSSRWTTGAAITWPVPFAAASSAGSAWRRSPICTTSGTHTCCSTLHTCVWSFKCRCLTLCILLPLSLHQSIWLHLLGQEAVEQEEEDFVAVGNSDRSSGWHHSHRRHRCSRHGHRHPSLRRAQGEKPAEIWMRSLFFRFLLFCARSASLWRKFLHSAFNLN